jgi:hypothetical protein
MPRVTQRAEGPVVASAAAPIMVAVRALSPIHADRRYEAGETLMLTPIEAAALLGAGVAAAA